MNEYTLSELRKELRKRKLPISGNKPELYKRLRLAENSTVSEESDGLTGENALTIADQWESLRREREQLEREKQEFSEQRAAAVRQVVQPVQLQPEQVDQLPIQVEYEYRPRHTVQEAANALPEFDPICSDMTTIENWVQRADRLKRIFNWSDALIILASATRLKGAARLWYDRSLELGATWIDFCNEIVRKFHVEMNETDIHRKMGKRKQRPGETAEEYLYDMMMLGEGYRLTSAAIVRYALEGLAERDLVKHSSQLAAIICQTPSKRQKRITSCTNLN